MKEVDNIVTQGGFYISQIKQLQDRIFVKLLKKTGLDINGAQGRILYVLWKNNKLTMSEISIRTSLANTSLTSMVDRMVEKGILFRENNPINRRELFISLTPVALAMRDAYEEISQHMNNIFYENISEKEMEEFERVLSLILRNLKKFESIV